MSALTFEILSTELTLALSEQSDTPPDTTARCNLGRDKVMVLVEYPLDSAQAEPMASQTLDWLEAYLRNQFDTAGLPEEAADLAEAGEEVPVQLFLKHRSEPKPFTMRSFIWKVDDGFDEIFGNPAEAFQATSEAEAAENIPIFRHPAEVLTHGKPTYGDQGQTPPLPEEPSVKEATVTSAVDDVAAVELSASELSASELSASELPASELAASEPHHAGFLDAELNEPVPSELDEEHLLLDLEPDLDLDPSLSHDLETELGSGMDSPDLDFENYLSLSEPGRGDLSSEDLSSGALSSASDEPLEIEAEFSPVSSSPASSSIDLDDLATGLTYPSVTPSPQTVDTGAAFDADLAAGVASTSFSESSSTELSLPGEAPTITSSELDLPTVDLPGISEPDNSPSGDFFTFDSDNADAVPTDLQMESEGSADEVTFSQSTPTLEDDLSVEFGLSPEEAPPAVHNADLSASDLSLSELGDIVPEPDPEPESPVTDPEPEAPVTESQSTEPQSTGNSTDEDDLHLFDLPTADESLSDFDLPPDLPAVESPSQGSGAETIEDYLSTEELPSDDLSSADLRSEEPDSIDAYNLFEDPLMAEVDAAESAAESAGPPSLDLSPLAYHILADDSDDDGGAQDGPGHSKTNQGDRTDDGIHGLAGEVDSRDANGYASDDYASDDYASDDYASDDYEDDSPYYLEDEDEDYEEPLEEVALIDDGEVERQRDQWQQQSKSNPWIFVGALGLVVLGVLGFVFTRPCSFGARCDRIQTAQAQGDEAIGNLRLDASLESVNTSKKELERAIQSLKPIPVWSPHHDEAQAILPEYENQVEALELVTKAQGQAYQAAEDSQNPPHSVSTWSGIAEDWLAATQSLEAVPADSPVRELAERKLLEYRSNRATILVRIDAESKAEVSLRQSQQAATKATNLTQNAGTLQDWEDALAAWESAVDSLSQIPQGTNAHGEAQQILPGYLKQLEEVRDRTEQERSASRELFQAKQRAADAQRAESEDRWTIAAQNWKTALSQLQGVRQGTLAHSEAQALTGLYTSALNKAESNLQIALRFQPVEPEFFAACGTTTAQKCTYSVRGGNVRLDLFQGYDSIIDQSITPPDQRVIVTAPNDQYVNQSNQLLKSITLLSTQAQVPIELYDAQGAFLARYRPDLNGFVREQG